MAERAQATYIHSTRGGSTLSEVVLSVTRSQALSWDSYYRDGQWIVTATFDGSQALWNFEPTGNTVHPLNDVATAWMGASPRDTILDSSAINDTVIIHAPADTHEPVRLVAVPELEPETQSAPQPGVSQISVTIEESELPLNIEPAEMAPVKKQKRGRAKVPSWDEILFGGPKNSS